MDYDRLTMNGQRSWRTLKLWGKLSNLKKNIWRRILCFWIELYIPLNIKGLEMLKFIYSIVVQSLSCVWLFVTPWTAACQASLPFTISHNLLKLMLLSWWCHPTISSCHPLLLLPSLFPSIRVFSSVLVLCISWRSIEASASASVLPMNIQDWFPLGLNGWISLQSKGLSRVFSSTRVWKHQFFGAQPSLWSTSHIRIWLLEKTYLWLYGPLYAKQCLCFLIHCLGLS